MGIELTSYRYKNMLPQREKREREPVVVRFASDAYDPFIDFSKGVAIVLVLLTHCLMGTMMFNSLFVMWGLPAVPMLLTIQVFHAYKRGFDNVALRWGKIWKRVFRPLLVTIIFTYAVAMVQQSDGMLMMLKKGLYWGGYGPGSYYPWIYLQFAVLLVVLAPVLRRLSLTAIVILFIVLSQGVEYLCSILQVSGWLYRLLAVRYLFVIALGCVLVRQGFRINRATLVLAVVSLLATLFFGYFDVNLQPWVFKGPGEWRVCHWICYFYIAYLVMYFVWLAWKELPPQSALRGFVCKLGRYSYDIFLFQMFFFYTFSRLLHEYLSTIGNPVLEGISYTLICLLSTIFCVVIWIEWVKPVVAPKLLLLLPRRRARE